MSVSLDWSVVDIDGGGVCSLYVDGVTYCCNETSEVEGNSGCCVLW